MTIVIDPATGVKTRYNAEMLEYMQANDAICAVQGITSYKDMMNTFERNTFCRLEEGKTLIQFSEYENVYPRNRVIQFTHNFLCCNKSDKPTGKLYQWGTYRKTRKLKKNKVNSLEKYTSWGFSYKPKCFDTYEKRNKNKIETYVDEYGTFKTLSILDNDRFIIGLNHRRVHMKNVKRRNKIMKRKQEKLEKKQRDSPERVDLLPSAPELSEL